MTSSPDLPVEAYRTLGLIGNPFKPREPFQEVDEPGVKLISHAAAHELLRAIDDAADKDEPAPIWVEKAGNLPAAYYVAPLAGTLAVLGSDQAAMGVLPAYVPLDMMRLGRVRAVLSVIAERVAGVDIDLTLAALLRRILAEPDAGIDEFEAIADSDLTALDEALESDPRGTIERYFGPCVGEREGSEDLEALMRVATARVNALETDVSEDDEERAEEAPDDMLSEVFTESVGDADGEPEPESKDAEPDDGLPRADDLVAYYVAYVAKHYSPVIARAMRAYRAQGTTSMTQELKVTKAPMKTLAALVRFAACRHRKIAIVFDRFEMWTAIPEDLKNKLLGTFSQLRWALRDGGLLVFVVSSGHARELDEQFGSATRVLWDLAGLADVAGDDPPYSENLAQSWLEAATLPGRDGMGLRSPPLADAVASSDGSLRRTSELLAAAVDEAARIASGPILDAASAPDVSP